MLSSQFLYQLQCTSTCTSKGFFFEVRSGRDEGGTLDLKLLHGGLGDGELDLALLRSGDLRVVDNLELLEVLVLELLRLGLKLLFGDLTHRDLCEENRIR